MIMRQESQCWEMISMETSIFFSSLWYFKLEYISTRAGGIYPKVIWPLVCLFFPNGGDSFCWPALAPDLDLC